jgi:hypothetical protein
VTEAGQSEVGAASMRPDTPQTPHTDNTRLEAFSDAIFGFAATLLVVSLDVPSSYDALVRGLYGFAYLVWIWSAHREFFKRFPLGDQTTVVLNTLLLFVVLFYVYPLKFLTRLIAVMMLRGRYGGEPIAMRGDQLPGLFIVYGIGWAAVFACFSLLYLHAARRTAASGMVDTLPRTARDRSGAYALLASIGVLSAGLALCGVGVHFGVPGWSYVLVGPVLSSYWGWRNRVNKVAETARQPVPT